MFCRMKSHQREAILELIEAKAFLAAREILGGDAYYEKHRVIEAERNFEELFANETPQEDAEC